MLKKLQFIQKRIRTDKKFAVMFALYMVTVVVTTFMFIHWEDQIGSIIFVLFIISIMLLSLLTWSMAALAIFRSLLVVGAGLSLLLFIAQSYCGLLPEQQVADEALKSLIGLGIIFIVVTFAVRLYRELFGDQNAKREFDKLGALKVFRDANKGKDSILILIFYASFMGLILGQLFQVLYPIFSNLCVYHP